MQISNAGNIIMRMSINQSFYTAKELSQLWGVTVRMISIYCTRGEIPGAEKVGSMWLIPKSAKKPVDRRLKSSKQKEHVC